MKLIVHIGTGKTGTTSVQQAMKINSDLLESQGITYPTTIFDDHNILEAAVLEYDKLHRVYKSKFSQNQNEPKNIAQDLISHIKMQKTEYIVLSGEYFFGLNKTNIKLLLDLIEVDTQDVKVICYIRNPSSFWLSGVQQYLKGSSNLSGLIEKKYNFKSGIINWGDIVGNENLFLRCFEKSRLIQNDITQDFCDVLSKITKKSIQMPSTENRNASVFSEQCIMMQELRQELLSLPENTFSDDSRKLIRQIHLQSKDLNLTKMIFKPEVVQYIEHIHEEDVNWLLENYGLDINCELIKNEEMIRTGKNIVSESKVRNMLANYDKETLEVLKSRVMSKLSSRE